MGKWNEFGEQVNRLVYALAGRKYQADIELANRNIAERICYSEVSVRMMRQGRFHPREARALETLVEIGKTDAELGRDWAVRLLHSGQHPDPEPVLQRLFPPDENSAILVVTQAGPAILPRLAGTGVGTLAMLLLWTYGINPAYPAPHELPWLREILWGFLIGLGLAGGLAVVDFLSAKNRNSLPAFHSRQYLVLPASGMLGALIWKFAATLFFTQPDIRIIRSSWIETLCFGAGYGMAFAVGMLLLRRGNCTEHPAWKPWQIGLLFVVVSGGAALAGFLLAVLQPSFATQKDIDIAVGILLRTVLVLLVSVFFPAE